MSNTQPTASLSPASALSEALTKNQEATEAVQEVADELAVVHTVLSEEVAKIARDNDSDLGPAVERTATLEKTLSETARKMVEVNEALAEQHASFEHLNKAR